MQQYPMLIDGAPAQADDGRWFETQDPYTGEILGAGGPRDAGRRGPR